MCIRGIENVRGEREKVLLEEFVWFFVVVVGCFWWRGKSSQWSWVYKGRRGVRISVDIFLVFCV